MSRLVVEAISYALEAPEEDARPGVRALEGATRPDRTSVKVPVDLLDRLDQYATALGTSKAALIDWGLSLKRG